MSNKLVRKVAYELAGAFFDNADVLEQGVKRRSWRFRLECKDQHEFIAKHWPKFVEPARRVLAHMLTKASVSEDEKDAIFNALLEDRGFPTENRSAILNPIFLN